MKTFDVVLTKSYIITIQAEDKTQAKALSEFFTNDIQNISMIDDETKYKFKIENIDCKLNDALEAIETYENN